MALFEPASGAAASGAEEGTTDVAASPKDSKRVDEDQFKQDASSALKELLSVIIAMDIIQVIVKGNFKDKWAIYFIL